MVNDLHEGSILDTLLIHVKHDLHELNHSNYETRSYSILLAHEQILKITCYEIHYIVL